ncbi:MAG TPA: hypothetical protein VNI57_09135 [Candidatus Saccharimonadales bacterium]|nr:hypothetical protein [Candidatus Saccharimonadales bacterium]
MSRPARARRKPVARRDGRDRSAGRSRAGASTPLAKAVRTLAAQYGPPKAHFPVRPFEMILWENAAYLAGDERRRHAFETLKTAVGTRPEEILAATTERLESVTGHGILPARFAEKLREAARIALESFDGDLPAVLRRPAPEAVRALRKFPGIGEPGAEKILLFAAKAPFLAPDSNALRVLNRLGISPERKSYAATYAAARDVAREQLGDDPRRLREAHLLLRRHGQELCRRSDPACERCPLARDCAHARAHGPD